MDPGKEVVNAGYMNMLAQRGVPLRDHALLGSDDSTDAGGGIGGSLSYAMHSRCLGPGRGRGGDGGGFSGRGGRGRAMTLVREESSEEMGGVRPLRVRKMSSM